MYRRGVGSGEWGVGGGCQSYAPPDTTPHSSLPLPTPHSPLPTCYLDPPGLALVRSSRSVTPYQPDSSSTRSRGSTVCVPYRAVQCRCGPVTLPVEPTLPMICPRVTVSPTDTSGSLR